uniref:Reverse transcriptase domain-containing protein n=1 Tax=Macrostomum lignano TaxID=282301 RepID=A0A1I8F7L5_9PLAT
MMVSEKLTFIDDFLTISMVFLFRLAGVPEPHNEKSANYSREAKFSFSNAAAAAEVPNTEVYLQGSVLKPFTEFLLTRLRGICDSPGDEFRDQESVFTCAVPASAAPACAFAGVSCTRTCPPTFVTWASPSPLTTASCRGPPTRCRCSPWTRPAAGGVPWASNTSSTSSPRAPCFRRGLLKITVYRVYRPGAHASLAPESSLVEVSGLGPSSLTAGMVESVLSVRDQLKSLVLLAKHDQKAPKARRTCARIETARAAAVKLEDLAEQPTTQRPHDRFNHVRWPQTCSSGGSVRLRQPPQSPHPGDLYDSVTSDQLIDKRETMNRVLPAALTKEGRSGEKASNAEARKPVALKPKTKKACCAGKVETEVKSRRPAVLLGGPDYCPRVATSSAVPHSTSASLGALYRFSSLPSSPRTTVACSLPIAIAWQRHCTAQVRGLPALSGLAAAPNSRIESFEAVGLRTAGYCATPEGVGRECIGDAIEGVRGPLEGSRVPVQLISPADSLRAFLIGEVPRPQAHHRALRPRVLQPQFCELLAGWNGPVVDVGRQARRRQQSSLAAPKPQQLRPAAFGDDSDSEEIADTQDGPRPTRLEPPFSIELPSCRSPGPHSARLAGPCGPLSPRLPCCWICCPAASPLSSCITRPTAPRQPSAPSGAVKSVGQLLRLAAGGSWQNWYSKHAWRPCFCASCPARPGPLSVSVSATTGEG